MWFFVIVSVNDLSKQIQGGGTLTKSAVQCQKIQILGVDCAFILFRGRYPTYVTQAKLGRI